HWREAAHGAGVAGRVRFVGMLTGDDKADMLARADLFALPSIGEGLSMAMLEALANRTAVMLSPGCNFPAAADAGAGVVVDANVDEMAAALSRLLASPDRLRAMGEAARSLVARDYSWDAITDRLIETYSEGMARKA